MVIWLIGLSGSGKTTLGRAVLQQWQVRAPNTVLVDGDEVRRIFRQDNSPADYTLAGRRQNAERILELCRWLDQQGINVVCSILSIFPDLREQNRQTFSDYYEVYLNPGMDVLIARDTKGLYAKALAGEMKDMVGVDLPFPEPEHPDMTIDTGKPADIAGLARDILSNAGVLR
ncbi:adenylyl-sulfate kinase [Chitinilyticum litopenaei]|uniref:adenylyl-sulfate kinase n=1 Tax=Chitinilyticum litopenaei TaxID=1121276 RepID=UPI00041B0669|nr:adenylyl-sulfate kinase [Chitinilyticum litopenaei]